MSGRSSPVLPAGSEPPTPKKKKSKAGSLRRAFSWLRARRKKKKKSEGEQGKGKKQESKAGANPEDGAKLSVQYKQDNIFSPSGPPPPHLEELHNEAQQGLKSLQHQEKQKQSKHGPDQTDNHSLQLFSSRTSGYSLPEAETREQASQLPGLVYGTHSLWRYKSSDMLSADSVCFRSRSQSYTTDTASEDALSVRSEMIQRVGSTFRPHDAAKPSAKLGKKRKERRTTVVGIPQHIQKELGLPKNSSSHRKVMDVFSGEEGLQDDLPYGEGTSKPALLQNGKEELNSQVIYIPTIDGNVHSCGASEVRGAHVSLQSLELSSYRRDMDSDGALQRHIDKVYYDDTFLDRKITAKLSPLTRPKSLAVPGMTTTTGQSELMSPVMSISPQGTYMSKIIPNAILPPLVDVIALSRNSVRTLSRCTLSTASPASLRHYCSQHHSSSSENWSHSQSTETIVSNSSTISSQGGSGAVQKRDKDSGAAEPPTEQVPISSSANCRTNGSAAPGTLGLPMVPSEVGGRASPAYSVSSSTMDSSDTISITSDRSSIRSVSLRKSKKPPAPPRRSYSLQQQKELGLPPRPEKKHKANTGGDPWVRRLENQSSGEGEEIFLPASLHERSQVPSANICALAVSERPTSPGSGRLMQENNRMVKDQPLSSGVASRRKENSPGRSERTLSPSSGYSSQSGTPTLPTKGLINYPSSPINRRPQPIKPERLGSVRSTAVSVSSSLTSLSSSTSDSVPQEVTSHVLSSSPVSAAPVSVGGTSTSIHQRFVIPPHPKVPAPLFPPPSKPPSKIPAPLLGAGLVSAAPAPLLGAGLVSAAPAPSPLLAAGLVSAAPAPLLAAGLVSAAPAPLLGAGLVSAAPAPSPLLAAGLVSAAPAPLLAAGLVSAAPAPAPLLGAGLVSAAPAPSPLLAAGLVSAAPAPPTPILPASISKAGEGPPVLIRGNNSPPPSPPPSYHPPPPPVRNTDSPSDVSFPSSEVLGCTSDALWPPPPPPAPCEADLSMANFPPPEDVSFSTLPPLQSESSIVPKDTAGAAPFQAVASSCSAAEQSTGSSLAFSAKVSSKIQQQRPSNASSIQAEMGQAVQAKLFLAPASSPNSISAGGLPSATVVPGVASAIPAPSLTAASPATLQHQPSFHERVSIPGTDPKLEAVAQNKSSPVPKEDASLPLVTPSLLQMVRLRSVQRDANKTLIDHHPHLANGDRNLGNFAPQKPIRKSLSLRSPPPAEDTVPSTPRHEASTLSPKASQATLPSSSEAKDGQLSPIRKSPASTASFIFAKSPKKIVIEPSSSPEAQADLKKNLVAELISYSGPRTVQTSAAAGKPQVQKKPSKIPPPIARKPSQGKASSPSSPQPQTNYFVPDAKAKCSSQEDARTRQGLSELADSLAENGRGQEPLPLNPPAQEKQEVEGPGP
ncbi:uncharacterized protein KIAA1522 homolog [Rhinatrema bivittatum]|uniref:uncharacterized protein KIAA1522 homolog n=1 Tax=Rhinatrema bivittatum TaxID=194408 RepID=UPI001128CDD1|nr:uncharacterized protein KIAA1522 homolog [Rhinatrema bivittatum]